VSCTQGYIGGYIRDCVSGEKQGLVVLLSRGQNSSRTQKVALMETVAMIEDRQSFRKKPLGQQAQVAGAGDGFGAVVSLELAIDIVDVALDCTYSDEQPIGNLAVGETGSDEVQHF